MQHAWQNLKSKRVQYLIRTPKEMSQFTGSRRTLEDAN